MDSAVFGGGGFLENGMYDIGKIGTGLQVVTTFREYVFTQDQALDLYGKLKVILRAIGSYNEEISKRAGKTQH